MGRQQQSKLYIIQFRELGIGDLVFALRGKKTSYSSLETFRESGLVIEMEPEWVRPFVEALTETHPTNKKDFEHFLINPPAGIQPTGVMQALEEHSPMVPTLCVVYMNNKKPIRIEKIQDYYQLLSLLSDAREDGLVKDGGMQA